MFSGGYMIYMVIGGILSLIGMFVQRRLQSKFNHYSQIGLRSNMTGAEVAQAMLRHYGIYDVKVVAASGFLTDHYNPADKTVNLSEPVYNARTISAAAVAAHECGHAVQHATAYSMLQLRSSVVPAVKVASGVNQFLLPIAIMAISSFPSLLMISVVALAVTTFFSLVTLPVEFDASRRALVWLEEARVMQGEEHDGAKDALWWAAMTYVAAALSAIVTLLYLVLMLMGARRDD